MTSRTNPKTVLLGGDPRHAEATAANGPIRPGMLLGMNTNGTVRPHNAAKAQASAMFAREADYTGNGIDDQFANGDNVPYWIGKSGDRFYALLSGAAQTIAVGALLESAGDGTLRAQTLHAQEGTTPFEVEPEGYAIVRAIEAVTTTDAVKRIKVEVI